MNKERLEILARDILQRVVRAANGARNTDDWADAEDNLSAPDGMDYWDWIEQAQSELLKEIDSLDSPDQKIADLSKKLDEAIDLLDCRERAILLDSWITKP